MRKLAKPRVCLMGNDNAGWALQKAEFEPTRQSLDFVYFSGLLSSDVVHTVYWPALLRYPWPILAGKRVISHFSHDPDVAVLLDGFEYARQVVTLWIVRSQHAHRICERLGLRSVVVPYTSDEAVFHSISRKRLLDDPKIRQVGLNEQGYLIGSFQSDTEGYDLKSPKLVKGPDIFADIVNRVQIAGKQIHVLLAGPRRFWLRAKLRELNVPYTFVGKLTEDDDFRTNNLSAEVINKLYNLVDLYVVASRKEGGPQAVLEAASCRCKIISTDVGHAADFLHPDCLFSDAENAALKICGDIEQSKLSHTIDYNRDSAARVSFEAVAPLWRDIYKQVLDSPATKYLDLRSLTLSLKYVGKRLWNSRAA